jgi:hypothetical protein
LFEEAYVNEGLENLDYKRAKELAAEIAVYDPLGVLVENINEIAVG